MTTITTTTYTCKGGVCGGCDIRHRTIAAAVECCGRHHARIVRGNGRSAYSDRRPVRTDGQRLDEWEIAALDRAERDE